MKALESECQARTPACLQVPTAIAQATVAVIVPDANGKAQLPPLAPGTYYLFGSTVQSGKSIIWNLKVVLKAGANTVTLDQGMR